VTSRAAFAPAAVGAVALAAAPALPLVAATGRDRCGWTCYMPAGVPAPSGLVHDTDLWSISPLLSIVALVTALAILASALRGHARQPVGAAAASTAAAVAVGALWHPGIHGVVSRHELHRVGPSPWMLVPILGAALASAALLAPRRAAPATGP
jgi:anti-sigma-K factor RskA